MKIYTKGGDKGDTSLFGGQRVGKDHLRVATYGDIDELNAELGFVLALLGSPHEDLGRALVARLRRVQAELFTIGAHLATPETSKAQSKVPPVDPAWALALEGEIDEAMAILEPLTHFVLPGGAPAASALHVSRTTCRRAERAIVALARIEALAPEVIVYVNRLSDWLFTMARLANHLAGVPEPLWMPRARG